MNRINRLIDLNIKIEGLLRVLVVRDSEAAENSLDECIKEFNEIYESIKEPEDEQPVEQPVEIVAEPQPEPEPEPINEPEPTATTEVEIEVEPTIEPIAEQAVTEQPIAEEPAPTPAPEPEAEPVAEIETEPDVEVIVDENPAPADVEGNSNIKVDEMISRQEASDLKKAFTINDKFRFRRELFGNSEENFVDTIDLITAMKSFDEAQEYIYEDLGWDRTNEDVADFMTIIANHFNA